MKRVRPRLLGWPFPTTPTYRVMVRRRHPHGIADALDVAMYGRRWSWWCSCDSDPHHVGSQEMALHIGLSHLADVHNERPTPRRR